MRDIAKLNENDKKALFHNTAAKTGMTDAEADLRMELSYQSLLNIIVARSRIPI